MTFGQTISYCRKDKKLSQAELGKLSGINGDIIGKYERDEMKPSIETAKKLADALSVSLDYLVGDGDLKVLDKKTLQRLEDIEKLSEADKQNIFTHSITLLKMQSLKLFNNVMLEVIQGDITKIQVDAIVNAANTSLLGGGGVDGAIHRTGGKAILEECQKIRNKQGGCKVGEAVITTAGELPAKFVIHTVGPVWNNGKNDEASLLSSAYFNSLKLALDNQLQSISFPNISTGIYKFPKEKAAKIAIQTVFDFLTKTDKIEKVIFVCYDDENYQIYSELLNQ